MCMCMYGEEGAQTLGACLRKAMADCATPLAGSILLTSSSKLSVRVLLLLFSSAKLIELV